MKILWITNIILPSVCEQLGISPPVLGGWLLSSAKVLAMNSEIELAIATIYSGNKLKEIKIENITYFLLPSNGVSSTKYNKHLEKYWEDIRNNFTPDIVHIHGTELAHGLAYIRKCGNKGVVISIQGLVSVIQRYYYSGISKYDIINNITFRDIIKFDNIFQQKYKMKARGVLEKEYIKSVKHIIGRTDWDKAHVCAINSDILYNVCNETLRETFYINKWSYIKCNRYSIFLSQANYPIKGLHQVLKAASLVIKEFPELKIYVAGYDITKSKSIKDFIKLSGYGKYIRTLITKYKLKDAITFTDQLNEKQICQQYLKANLFICPSSIENSPNSLGEAQILGMPFISSYVGGTPDMVNPISTNLLYRFDDVEMLADKICSIFRAEEWQHAHKSIEVASIRHDKEANFNTLISIYENICK